MKQKRSLPAQQTRLNTLAFLWNNYKGPERLEQILREKYLLQWPSRKIKKGFTAGIPSLVAASDEIDCGIALFYLPAASQPSEHFLKGLIQEKRRAQVIANDNKWLVLSGKHEYEMLLTGLAEIQTAWSKLNTILGQHYGPLEAETDTQENFSESHDFQNLHARLVEKVFRAAGANVEESSRGFLVKCPNCGGLEHKLVIHEQEPSKSDYFLGEVFATCKTCYHTWKEHSAINPDANFNVRRQPRCQCGKKFYYVVYAESSTSGFFEQAALGGECVHCGRVEVFLRED